MAPVLITVVTVLGLVIGSFLNVVIYRLPEHESLSSPRSHCMNCGHQLAWWENIPVFSWLALRGRCRSCKARISAQYPAIEALTAVLFLIAGLVFVPPIGLAAGAGQVVADVCVLLATLWFIAVAVALTVIDLHTHLLPNRVVYPSVIVVLVLELVAAIAAGAWHSLLTAVLGLVTLGGLYLLVAFISPKGMGLGDVKYAALIGLVLGWHGWAYTVLGLVLPFLIGAVFALALLLARRANRKTGIPFGPSMSLGAIVTLLWGEPLMTWYLSLWGLA